jgi:2-amino-4-hydroxy-6-hydroxymethyldihydropteridine diphosphokinase
MSERAREETTPIQQPTAVRRAFVALGSNLGDSRQNVLSAIQRIEQLGLGPVLRSSLWETEPLDCPAGSPRFINAVVAVDVPAAETPETMLARLQHLEREFGRTPKKILNEPRPLDLDLIAFGEEERNSPALTLPHPRAHERRFVLQPLVEIAPELVLPGQSKTVRALCDALPADRGMRKLRDTV